MTSAKVPSASMHQFTEELLRNPEAMRIVLDMAAIPINYCSADYTFVFSNKSHAALHGLTPEEVMGKKIRDVFGDEAFEAVRPYYDRVLRGEPVSYEAEVNFKMGTLYIQCAYNPVFSDNGEVIGWVAVINDMTRRHQLEKDLQENRESLRLAKEKAEAASTSKSEFLANMSHEIRTPMNAVVGLANLLNMTSPLTDRQREFIATLQLSAQSLLSLINDLLDITKIESSNVDLEHIPFTLGGLIREIVDVFSVQAHEGGVTLHYNESTVDGRTFLGDPLRIRQILTNLVSNAVKFTRSGGSVRVSVSEMPSAKTDRADVSIRVKDTGIGIPANKLSAVFDKFMQADMSTTRKYGGSGLGLSISKNLAGLMGGDIKVSSVPGEGSEFVLQLSLENGEGHIETMSARPEKNPAPIPEADGTVLLVEDHMPNVLVASSLLEASGYRCVVARNGREALEKVRGMRDEYCAILMDVQMPELDGLATTRLIREEELKAGYKRIPIIGVTAFALSGDRERCIEAGMDSYIAKPFRLEELRNKIAAAGNLRSTA